MYDQQENCEDDNFPNNKNVVINNYVKDKNENNSYDTSTKQYTSFNNTNNNTILDFDHSLTSSIYPEFDSKNNYNNDNNIENILLYLKDQIYEIKNEIDIIKNENKILSHKKSDDDCNYN